MSEQILPERPDAGQLRRMAKELRAAVRAGDRDAIQRLGVHVDADPATVSLSAAQLVVAREHGFASWPRLMEHLEARRLPVLSSLSPRRAVAASALDDGQTVVLAARVTSIVSDAPDGGRRRLRVVPVIGAAPGEVPDQREILVSCRGDARVRTARRVPSGEQLDGPGLTSGPDRFAIEDLTGVERVKPGRLILTAGTVASSHVEGEHRERVRFALRAENWDEFVVVCPGDMRLATARSEPQGLRSDKTLTADRLVSGQIVTVDGYVMNAGPDPADPGRVRLVLARALGLKPDERPDQREIVLSCPRDMVFETAVPHNIELAPPPR
jgi:hypothetical protein